MKKLKGKCKDCLGCNKIRERGFRGVRRCKYYEPTYQKRMLDRFILRICLVFAGFSLATIIAFIIGK